MSLLKKINISLCIGTKVEYEHCLKNNFSDCLQSNKKRYKVDLKCPSLLGGLKINQWNERNKKRKFQWNKTCHSVANEFSYCLESEISPCMGDMLKRFNDLYCHRPTRKRIYDLIQLNKHKKTIKKEYKRLKKSLRK